MSKDSKIYVEGENLRAQWKELPADFDATKDHLDISGKPVMERWETPFMHKLAEVSASKGGRVLELGFGLAIAATRMQDFDIKEHVIVECNDEVFKELEKWKAEQEGLHPNIKITPIKGYCEEVALEMEEGTFDGILYDTYPLSEEKWHTHQFDYISQHAYRLLRKGGVLTFCNLTSWGELLKTKYTDINTMFEETQVPELLKAGFLRENISWKEIPMSPPPECKYYSHGSMVYPTIIKQ